jgi:hypothetical protein
LKLHKTMKKWMERSKSKMFHNRLLKINRSTMNNLELMIIVFLHPKNQLLCHNKYKNQLHKVHNNNIKTLHLKVLSQVRLKE